MGTPAHTSFREYGDTLLATAREAIQAGWRGRPGWPLPDLDVEALPAPLRWPRATFVSLHRRGALRGCIGSMTAERPLIEDVAEHAYAAAFQDPRFTPLTRSEWADTTMHLFILSPLEALPVASEAELMAALRPGEDGLLLEDGPRQATFLPAVWDDLPDPVAFVRHLKEKGGWDPDYWSAGMRVYRYSTESIPA